MSIIPLYGHQGLRQRLHDAVTRSTLPSSLLLHGPRGVGKQRLALWLGQLLLCNGNGEHPCGSCQACRYVNGLAHPDLRWFFPRPRLDDPAASPQDVVEDYADAINDRLKTSGLYPAPAGTEAIYVATVRAVVQLAAFTPTLGKRKVFVIGDAERMVPQEGADAAANAFLKLLEEPPADTTIILTSSEPGALLPTIRSRVVSIRVPVLSDADVRAFVSDPTVHAVLNEAKVSTQLEERIRLAAGAPGALFQLSSEEEAFTTAKSILAAARSNRTDQMRAAFTLGGSKARGFFSDVLDALTVLLHQEARNSVNRGDARTAVGASRAIDAVEEAKLRAAGNVSPQLLSTALIKQIAEQLV